VDVKEKKQNQLISSIW